MNIATFDLNLLRVFAAIYGERSVSRAASAVGLSQPAMSNALFRLRQACADPLFVRTTSGMEPTPLAEEMIAPVRQALGILRDCLDRPEGFVPARSKRIFRLLMSDAGELAILPALVASLERAAPNAGVEVLRMPHESYKAALQDGVADLAIGNLPFLGAGFYQKSLFADPYCCIARRAHPSIKGTLSLSDYLAVQHVSVATGSADAIVERELARRRQQRSVRLRVTHYRVATDIVSMTDLLATVPQNIVRGLRGIQAFPLPITLPPADVRQFWHRRVHLEPANQWLRDVLANLKIDSRKADV